MGAGFVSDCTFTGSRALLVRPLREAFLPPPVLSKRIIVPLSELPPAPPRPGPCRSPPLPGRREPLRAPLG